MMRKLFLISLLVSSSAFAQHHHHGHWRPHHSGGWGWVVPAVVGGVVVYEITKPHVVVQQPPVVVQQPPVVVQQQNCSPWTEIRNPDGSVTVTRTCQ